MIPSLLEGTPLEEREAALLAFLESDEVEVADLMHLVCHARHRYRLLGAVLHHPLLSAGMANTIAFEVPPFLLPELRHILDQFFSNPLLFLHLESEDEEASAFCGLIEAILPRFGEEWIQEHVSTDVLVHGYKYIVSLEVTQKLCRVQNSYPIGFPSSYHRLYDDSEVDREHLMDWARMALWDLSWKDQMRFLRDLANALGVDEAMPSLGEIL